MKLLHVALVRTSAATCDRFHGDLLGLERVRERSAGAELCGALFGVEREHRMIDYANEWLRFEVLLAPRREVGRGHLAHVCLEVEETRELLRRCVENGVEVREVEKDGGKVVFIVDEDGNLYEIKQRATAG